MKKRTFALLFCFVFGLGSSSPALATDKTDLTIAVKTLAQLTSKIKGAAVMAIVYDPANAESRAEAESAKAIIEAGIDAPDGLKITPKLVSFTEVSRLKGEAKLAFLTRGLHASIDAIYSTLAAAGILTLTTTVDYVKANKCILGIVSKPDIEIFYSKAAADSTRISFSDSFTMLVSQI